MKSLNNNVFALYRQYCLNNGSSAWTITMITNTLDSTEEISILLPIEAEPKRNIGDMLTTM